jgi:hypothetical protein
MYTSLQDRTLLDRHCLAYKQYKVVTFRIGLLRAPIVLGNC